MSRPRKNPSQLRSILINLRLTAEEAEQFRAQASYYKKDLSEYLRDLANRDGDELHDQNKIRRDGDGNWEFLHLGTWKKWTKGGDDTKSTPK